LKAVVKLILQSGFDLDILALDRFDRPQVVNRKHAITEYVIVYHIVQLLSVIYITIDKFN
jgi:hypothetical protein